MYLTALSVGYAISSTDFDAVIHSVFRSAINLRTENGDLLLTLVAASEADLPQGIRVATPKGFSFESLRTGEKVTCRNGLLTVENAILTIDFAHTRHWTCDLPALKADLTNPDSAKAWNLVWQTLNQRQKSLGAEIVAEKLLGADETSESPVSRRAREAVRALVAATQRCDPETTSIISQLIGLGAGLTPSGDDFLVGYLAGLLSTVRGVEERQRFISSLGETVIHLSNRTNDISRTYLYHAAHGGQVSRRLETLSRAICRAENLENLLVVAESAMQAGHTSGMDSVTGLLVGLVAWEGSKTQAFD